MDALRVTSGHGQVARPRAAHRDDHSVVLRDELQRVDCLTHVRVCDKRNALRRKDIDATLHNALVQLHVWNSVHEQAANAIGALVDSDRVSRAVELVCGGKTRGARANHGDALAGAHGGGAGDNPALLKRMVDDGDLNALDGHGVRVDAEHARALARGGAHAPGELGKVVCEGELVIGLLPAAAVHKVVPFRNDVSDGTPRAALAKRHAAVHASRRLLAHIRLCRGRRNLLKVLQTGGRIAQLGLDALVLHEAMHLVENAVLLGGRRTGDGGRGCSNGGLHLCRLRRLRCLCGDKHSLIVDGHNAHKLAHRLRPRRKQIRRHSRSRDAPVLCHSFAQPLGLLGILHLAEAHELRVAPERARGVQDICNAAAHSCGKVPADTAENDHSPARHVLAAVVADALADGRCARVAHAKALRSDAPDEGLAGRRTVETDVADNDVVLGAEAVRVFARPHNDRAAREALAHIVVCVALQLNRHALRKERAERLARSAPEANADGVVR
eukprot:Opistho-2@20013